MNIIDISHDHVTYNDSNGVRLNRDIYEWLTQYVGRGSPTISPTIYSYETDDWNFHYTLDPKLDGQNRIHVHFFVDIKDGDRAMLFKLRWGGVV